MRLGLAAASEGKRSNRAREGGGFEFVFLRQMKLKRDFICSAFHMLTTVFVCLYVS